MIWRACGTTGLLGSPYGLFSGLRALPRRFDLAPGLFDLTLTRFEDGMAALAAEPIAQALDAGDVIGYAELAGFDEAWAFRVRNLVGDCGLCPLVSARLARDPAHRWLTAPPISSREASFFAARLGPPSFAAADGGASV